MANRKYRKGARVERELRDILEEHDFAVVRSAGSKKVDLLAGRRGLFLGIEVKSTSKNVLRVSTEDVKRAVDFCKKFGCKPILAVKFPREEFRVFELTEVPAQKYIVIKKGEGELLPKFLERLLRTHN